MENQQQKEQVAAVGGALKKFPVVVWERIIEATDSTQDILNVFTAFPELKRLSNGNEFSWLIDEVLPFILPKHLDPIQNLNCRLVSKRWNSAFRTMLENHPARLPYKSPEISNAGISTDHRFISPSCQMISTNFYKFIQSGFASADEGAEHNPFPGRRLAVDLNFTSEVLRRYTNLSEAEPYFQKFGHHVSSLKGKLFCNDSGGNQDVIRDFLEPLLRWLSYFPNLKSLELDACYNIEDEEKVAKSLATIDPIPVMPFKLEMLDISLLGFYNGQTGELSAIYNWFVSILITHDKVERLCINSDKWNPHNNLASLFPRLGHLRIEWLDFEDMEPVFQQLLTDRVRKLAVDHCFNTDVCNVLESLQPYKIECLVLDCYYGYRKSFCDPLPTLPTITDLTIYVLYDKAHFGFLKALPSLEYLTLIFYKSGHHNNAQSQEEDITGNEFHAFNVAIGSITLAGDDAEEENYAWKMFESIWALVPSLKVLNLHGGFGPGTLRQYVREVPNKVFKSLYYHQGD